MGIGLLLIGQQLWPIVWPHWQRIRGRLQQTIVQARAGVDVRLLAETAVFVQPYHLGRTWAALDQVFVPPRFLVPPAEIDPQHTPDWGAGQLDYIWPELAAKVATPHPPEMTLRQLLQSGRRVAVIAEPGAGKTMLLAYITHLCATATHDGKYAFLAGRIPVLAHLAELDVRDETAEPFTPLATLLHKRLAWLSQPDTQNLLQQRGRAGNLLLLLDGWDDLAATQCHAPLAWLHRLLAAYPNIQVIMAAALDGYGPLLSVDFTWTVLRPWRPGEVETFAAKWAKALSNNPLAINRYWRPGRLPLETTHRFWMTAFGKTAVAATEPRRQLDLMGMSLPAFFLQDGPTAQQKMTKLFWQGFAYALKSQQKLSLTAAELQALANDTLATATETAESGTQTQLLDSLSQSSLFIQDAHGCFRFLSGMWRDYLAAQYMAAHSMNAEAKAWVQNPYWRSVLRFYVAQVGAADLAHPLLQAQVTGLTRHSLFQVASWMSEAPDAGEWRRQTLVMLGQLARQRTFTQLLRQRAAAALVQTDETGTMTFVKQLLERSDPFLRRAGVIALSYLGLTEPQEVADLLQTFLEDGDARVRQTAVSALAWLATPTAEKPLLAALIEGDAGMSKAAAKGLALNGQEGVEILREALEDESAQVRQAAIHGLALLDEPWVEKTLVQLERKDPEAAVRTTAATALAEIHNQEKPLSWRPLAPKQQRWLVDYAIQENRVVPDGAAAQPFLMQVLTESPLPAIRAAAALTLGQAPLAEFVPALETAVRDSDHQVQEAAFTTLCLIHRAFTVL